MSNAATQRDTLYAEINEHEQWIQSNSYDAEGVKERREWINDCQHELDKLGE